MLYTVIFIFLLYCIFKYDIQNKVIGKNSSYLFLFVLLVSMSSLRYRMGGDGLFYDDYYQDMPSLSSLSFFLNYQNEYGYQPLWVALIAVCRSLSDSIILFQLVHALLFNVFLFVFISQYSKKPFSVLMLLIVSLMYFYLSFEIQREVMAVIIFLINIKNLEKKKWIRYYLLVFLSITFHISAIILIFLPLFRLIKLNKWLVYIMLLGSFLISIFRSQLLSVFNLFLLFDVMSNKASLYSEFTFSLLGFLSFYFVRVILFIPIGFFLANDDCNNSKYKWLYSSFFVISVLSQFFVGFERFLNYLFPLYFVLVIDFIYNRYSLIESFLKRSVIIITMILHLFFILDYKLFITNDFGNHYYSIFFPYNSILKSEINQEREDFHEN